MFSLRSIEKARSLKKTGQLINVEIALKQTSLPAMSVPKTSSTKDKYRWIKSSLF